MSSPKGNLKYLFSMFILISSISLTYAHARNKRAATNINDNVALGGLPDANKVQVTKPTLSSAQAVPLKPAENAAFDGAKQNKKEPIKIAETSECAADVKTFCSDKINSYNFLVLECLQDNEKTANKLSDICHHYLWTYKLRLTRDSKFQDASSEACQPELEKHVECQNLEPGETIPCLIEHYEDIKSKPCSMFLNKMASIIFSDYRFMNFFIKDCKNDIVTFKCGRIESLDENEDDRPHSQGKTISCLNEHRKELTKSCKKSIYRVAELQSDDFHLDRPLYYACKDDRENLCEGVTAGEGAVFRCLYKHLGDTKLSDNCRARLEERQQLIAEDVKIDKSFYAACKEDIRVNQCTIKGHRREGGVEEDLSRSSILLCLEEVQGERKNLKSECLQQMFELRSELMEDYKISPELVSACEAEIAKFCPLRRDGTVVQCLMKGVSELSQNMDEGSSFSSECIAGITRLVQVINPGEDIRLDDKLMRACGDVVTQACSKYHAGQGDVITCLLENLDHDEMTDECENELLVIQYFAARDFRLDFHLFKQCHDDALRLCNNNGFSDPNTMSPDEGPVIFSCLHRHLRSDNPNDKKPSRPCIHEIKRVMRERSFRVNLMPEVEAACLEDLARHCSGDDEHRKHDGEMACLQSLDDLTEKCRVVVGNFTKEASEDIEIDRTLIRSCYPMMRRFCGDLLNSDAIPNEVLECLIDHKNHNEMDDKCAASIEHHQIISLKDFQFNLKFRDACQVSVSLYCNNKRTKYEVIACLSEIVRNDTLRESSQRIEDRCRRQLRFELLQRGETIDLDPELKSSCSQDIHDFCRHKKNGEGEVVECLRAHSAKLSKTCYRVLFQRERDDAIFGDYTLLHVCKDTIKKYCSLDADEADILKCLIENKDSGHDFDDRCRQVVQRRQVEQARDIELNPHLQKACRLDIPKFCSDVYKNRSPGDKDMEGKVIDCLKKAYTSKKKVLTPECKLEVQARIREAAVNINLNPILLKICKADIKQFCMDDIFHMKVEDIEGEGGYNAFGNGAIMECLKKHFKELKDYKCKEEVAYSIAESRVDIHEDPMLHTACQQDLITHCKEVSQGQGRQMSCLLSLLLNDPNTLTMNCKNMLQGRKDLWEAAAQVAPAESFSEIFEQMSSSPARNYFFAILFTVIGVIFVVGLTCGRVTKRVRAEIKNK